MNISGRIIWASTIPAIKHPPTLFPLIVEERAYVQQRPILWVSCVLLKCRTGIYHFQKGGNSSLLLLVIGSSIITIPIFLTGVSLLGLLNLSLEDRWSYISIWVLIIVRLTTSCVGRLSFIPPTYLACCISLALNLSGNLIILWLFPLLLAIIV